jgi:hypothetical protein
MREHHPSQPGCALACLHRPYASVNWIRFNGSLRIVAVSQPLDGTPLVNASIRNPTPAFVKSISETCMAVERGHDKLT